MKNQTIDTHTAEISTASINIRTLTVGRRQVTLALFKQVLEEEIFDYETGTLRGVGWGHVRYLIEGYDHEQAINLLWQKGEELRRCLVHREISSPRIKDVILGQREAVYKGRPLIDIKNGVVAVMPSGLGQPLCCGSVCWGGLDFFPQIEDLELDKIIPIPEPKFGNRDAFDKYYAQHSALLTDYYKKCERELNYLLQIMIRKHEKREILVKSLFNLPQLFIAV